MDIISSGHHINTPLEITLKRYKEVFYRKPGLLSITRELQYELLFQLKLKGRVLDIGGGEHADYKNSLICDNYSSINIDPSLEPNWVVKAGEILPIVNDSYDTVISFNTIEHIFDAQFILDEIYRILKHGGEFISSVPFLYPIHASPGDYFRPTPSWWMNALTYSGFKEITITPLVWGPFSTGFVCSGMPGPLKIIRQHYALILDMLYAYVKKIRYASVTENNHLVNYSLAFFVNARK